MCKTAVNRIFHVPSEVDKAESIMHSKVILGQNPEVRAVFLLRQLNAEKDSGANFFVLVWLKIYTHTFTSMGLVYYIYLHESLKFSLMGFHVW